MLCALLRSVFAEEMPASFVQMALAGAIATVDNSKLRELDF